MKSAWLQSMLGNRRHALRLAIALVAVVVVLAVAVVAAWVQHNQPPPRPRTVVLPMATPHPTARVEPPITVSTTDAGPDTAPTTLKRGSPGCGQPPPHQGTRKVVWDSRGREVNVYVPTTYDANSPRPVVMLFHDALETAKGLWWDSGFQAVAEEHELIIVLPRDRMMGDWGDGFDINAGVDAINLVQEKWCVDFRRIYAVGNGAGAALVERLACGMPEIRAFATMSHRSSGPIECPDRDPIPYIHFTAIQDQYLPLSGEDGCGGEVTSLAAHEEHWQARNRCGSKRVRYSRWGKNECWTWDCAAAFVSCRLDAGRGWPKRDKKRIVVFDADCDGQSLSDYDMAGEIWSFFEQTSRTPFP